MKIKICGLKDKTNLAQVTLLRPDYLGFIFHPLSPRYMAHTMFPADLESIPGTKTGVFVDSDFNEIDTQVKQYKLDAIQFHGNETPAFCEQFSGKGQTLIKAFSIDEGFNFNTVRDFSFCDYFLFDTKGKYKGGNGTAFDWQLLSKYNQEKPFILSGGISDENIDEVLNLKGMNIHAIDLNSKVETSPGIKNIEKIKHIISKLKSHHEL
ncbi:MAG: phosphoribosylanthranilate isomerase [Bacteroidetes bacterium]|nr:phosphoribosylanthranilate isomerase [Bacteroidota bacterium]